MPKAAPLPLLSPSENSYLDRALSKARSKCKDQPVSFTRRFPHLSRTCDEARYASWRRVETECSRLFFNITTFGARNGDRRRLSSLSREITRLLIALDSDHPLATRK